MHGRIGIASIAVVVGVFVFLPLSMGKAPDAQDPAGED